MTGRTPAKRRARSDDRKQMPNQPKRRKKTISSIRIVLRRNGGFAVSERASSTASYPRCSFVSSYFLGPTISLMASPRKGFEAERCLGRTESTRQITNEPWWSMPEGQRKRGRPLSGVHGEVRSKEFDRASIVRDVR